MLRPVVGLSEVVSSSMVSLLASRGGIVNVSDKGVAERWVLVRRAKHE